VQLKAIVLAWALRSIPVIVRLANCFRPVRSSNRALDWASALRLLCSDLAIQFPKAESDYFPVEASVATCPGKLHLATGAIWSGKNPTFRALVRNVLADKPARSFPTTEQAKSPEPQSARSRQLGSQSCE
jgi:hypothetical protein